MPDQPPESGQEAPQHDGPEGAPPGGSPPQPPISGSPPRAVSSGSADIPWGLLLFWALIIIAGLLYDNFGRNADVMLNISCGSLLVANGTVTYDGVPVTGKAQITIEDASSHYLTSKVADVKDGAFSADFPDLQLADGRDAPFRVLASYRGQEDNPGWIGWLVARIRGPQSLQGTTARYLNSTAPPSGWWWAVVAVALLLLTVLFTGPLSVAKARLLFAVTYMVTFSACLIPILLTVSISRSSYLRSLMQEAPVGILEATTDVLPDPQWLVNVGGAVQMPPKTPNPISACPGGAPEKAGGATPITAPGNTGNAPQEQTAASAGKDQASQQTNQAEQTKQEQASAQKKQASITAPPDPNAAQYPRLKGGLAIPLYVLILAMLGAAINMTRKVPAIQKDSDSAAATTLQGALKAIFTLGLRGDGSTLEDPALRKELIETYLYFLSAPFLVIAVYYLLQVVANSVTQPTLVVVAFGTGLMSNTAVEAIITFADKILSNVKNWGSKNAAPPPNPPPGGNVPPGGGAGH